MGDLIEIIEERPEHQAAVRGITAAAFGESELGHNGEADLNDVLRELPGSRSLVAVADGDVVGHIMFSPAVIESSGGAVEGLALGPMAVAPGAQDSRVGSMLVRHGIARSTAPFIVVIGHPGFYPRFGFVPASDLGISHGFDGIPQEICFIVGPEPVAGRVTYNEAFGPQWAGHSSNPTDILDR